MTLYTGNDDHIVLDLLTPFRFMRDGRAGHVRISGGLLGHWSVWTHARRRTARAHPRRGGQRRRARRTCSRSTAQVTDCNAALFDVAHDFHGCIAGCHEVLRRQGLLEARGASTRTKA